MSVREILDCLERIKDVAALAAIDGEVDDERMSFVTGFQLPENRRQLAYIRPMGQQVEDSEVIRFFSPCRVLKKGLWSGLSKDEAIKLLKMNEAVYLARFGLMSFDKQDLVVASADYLLNTLDPEELRAGLFFVCMAADSYERQCGGGDNF